MKTIDPKTAIAAAVRRASYRQAFRLAYSCRAAVLQYKAADDSGRWITIGSGRDGDGGTGTHVRIDGEGNILAGPKALTGKNLDDLPKRGESKKTESKVSKSEDSFTLQKPKSKESAPKHRQQEILDKQTVPPADKLDLGRGVKTLPDGRKVGITMLPVDEIGYDPARFQYKVEGVSSEGVSEKLKDVKVFRPEFAGQLLAWHDPDDGRVYVVNGHHRYELAKRTGYDAPMPVYLIDAKDANEARALGALANMAAGHGTALDAAKFMRETGTKIDDLQSRGVSIKGKVAEDGLVLSKLSDNLFNRVVSERERQGVALAIGKHLGSHDVQDQIYREVQRASDRGRNLTDGAIEEMALEAAAAPTRTSAIGGSGGLFGDELEETRSLLAERGMLKSSLRKQIAGDAKAFVEVSRRGRAEALTAAGNVIDEEKNKQLAQESQELLFAFDKLVNTKGEISDAVNRFAEQLADKPREQKRLIGELYKEITPALQSAYGGATGPASGSASDDSGSRESYGLRSRAVSVGGLRERVREEIGRVVRERYAAKFAESKHPREPSGQFTSGSSKPLDLTGWDKPIKQAPSAPGQKPLFDEVEIRFAIKDAFDRRVAKDKSAGQKQLFAAGAGAGAGQSSKSSNSPNYTGAIRDAVHIAYKARSTKVAV